jgi:hypothetical protein
MSIGDVIGSVSAKMKNSFALYESPEVFSFDKIPRSKMNCFRVELNGKKNFVEMTGGKFDVTNRMSIWIGRRLKPQNRVSEYNAVMIDDLHGYLVGILNCSPGIPVKIEGVESHDLVNDFLTIRIVISFDIEENYGN